MEIIRKFEPLWGVWKCESVLGEGGFGRVYKAVRNDGPHAYYSAIKHISVPANEQQLQDARRSGLYRSEKELSDYFNDIALDVQHEIDLMYALKANTNIVSYEDHLVVPKPDGIGYDIFIRMELLRDLSSIPEKDLTQNEAIKIGIDICSALEVCAKSNIIHRDIKPSNIFVNANGDYKLGDFGIARVLGSTTSGVSKKGTYSYMAPEIYKCEPANLTSDIYSLGVVLYRILNENRLPFMPLTDRIRAQDHEAALLKMVSGAPMPPPVNATPQMAAVILKACSYNKKDRFRSATEFKKALNDVLNGSYYNKHTVAVNGHKDGNTIAEYTVISEENRTQVNADTKVNAQPEKKAEEKKGSNKGFIAVAIIALIAVIALGFGMFKTESKPATESDSVTGSIAESDTLTDPIIEGLEYDITDDGVVITNYFGTAGNIKIPEEIDGEKVVRIGNSAFIHCSDITSIEIPDSVTSIGNSAFWNCSSLTSIDIPDSVTSIGGYAFEDCSSLTSIDIPDSVTSIGDYAFYNCDSLTSIEIPDSVTSIGSSAFNNCDSLTSIDIPDSVTSIGSYAFYFCSSLTSIEIPGSVTSIGNSAFSGCSALTSIEIPDGVTSIGHYAFSDCTSLTSIDIPDSVTSINCSTFNGCASLTSIEIPDSVTSIGYNAFWDCHKATVYAPHEASYYEYDDGGYKEWVVQ